MSREAIHAPADYRSDTRVQIFSDAKPLKVYSHPMMHILPAAKDEVAGVLNAAKTRKPVEWLVSKVTHAGDQAIFYLPGLGLAARGVIGTEPEDRGQGFGYGRYTATVRKIARLDRPLSLDFLRKNHPSWRWPYGRLGRTTIDGSIEERLKELLAAEPVGIVEEEEAREQIELEREQIKKDIMQRRGQAKFRKVLLDAYGRCCAISDCNAEDALEAAHIRTYKRADVNHVCNGILLRADLHTLFDLGLICVRTSTWKVAIAPQLKGTSYASLNGKSVRLPDNEKLWPSEALDYHCQKVFIPVS